jgi:type 1 glutamine amidotransferase
MGGASMIKRIRFVSAIFALIVSPVIALAKPAPLHVLAFYSTNVEGDHVDFALQALKFFADAAKRDNFQFESTTNWDDLSSQRLTGVQVVMWLNDSAHSDQQRAAFQQYMEHGGGWFGFHFAAYNDGGTNWPWFVQFLGGAVFYGNSWPPLPAILDVDDKTSPLTKHLPSHFLSPANEWYSWQPNPRANKAVKVLLTLDPSNFPLGFKDTLTGGDIPVVWTNTKYRMIYMNMGHGDRIFSDDNQNQMFKDALRWLAQTPMKK